MQHTTGMKEPLESLKQIGTIVDSGVRAEHTAEKTKKNEKMKKSSVDIIRTLHHWTEKTSTNTEAKTNRI